MQTGILSFYQMDIVLSNGVGLKSITEQKIVSVLRNSFIILNVFA